MKLERHHGRQLAQNARARQRRQNPHSPSPRNAALHRHHGPGDRAGSSASEPALLSLSTLADARATARLAP
ncbi:hypothetical protein AMK21_31365 [Streptomyces sp. CB00316]|uniref:hypothetical protein n=1 Tax=unclassified Streptomyces TaxID=2593676 RepID=UPI0009396807|nr:MULTISPECIES: hypothetical protein [unclassified Streptomyces]MBT2379720.1 hypothetical protein [Streptomyces sp. ISL-111]MBT2426352.1 hypothetical protein [Streptomyces sp. ISL-112]MBT2465285.1 hypothetical protein [Streptomyces sp. ISL-63]OKJ09395.1 hypothetical protein AMK21_31365 [Streptomyces sp. CB00316]